MAPQDYAMTATELVKLKDLRYRVLEIAGQHYGNDMIRKIAAQQPWCYSSISWLRTPCPAGFLDPLVSWLTTSLLLREGSHPC